MRPSAWRSILAGVCLCAVLSPAIALGAPAACPPPAVTAPSALLITSGGKVLWSRQPSTPRRVASTIKMLNALVVRERASLDETVTVAKQAAAIDDGDVGLKAGQVLTVRQLLEMMLVASANDAAEALALHIGGSEASYVKLMNAKAASLGLTGTHAMDPHGLGKRETSTAEDLSILARQVMADPVLCEIVSKTRVSVPRTKGKASTVSSTDELLRRYRGLQGVKTGYTRPAGFCFVGAARRGDLQLFGVVLGTGSNAERFSQMRTLLDWGFANYRLARPVSAGTTMAVVPVIGGVDTSVTAIASREVTLTVFAGDGPPTTRLVVDDAVSAPVAVGQQVGVVEVSHDGAKIASVPLVAAQAIPIRPTPQPIPKPEPVVETRPSLLERALGVPAALWRGLSLSLERVLG